MVSRRPAPEGFGQMKLPLLTFTVPVLLAPLPTVPDVFDTVPLLIVRLALP